MFMLVDAVKDENLDLKEEKKEIEERLWNLEMMLRKHLIKLAQK